MRRRGSASLVARFWVSLASLATRLGVFTQRFNRGFRDDHSAAIIDLFRSLGAPGCSGWTPDFEHQIIRCRKRSRFPVKGQDGKSLDEVLGEMTMVAEGVNTTRAIRELSKELNIEMPISDQVYKVLFENKSPHSAVEDLMMRDPKSEKI